MKHINYLLAGALLAASPAWAHGDKADQHAHVVKEQKDWGIAGEAKQVTRTITLTMTDNMRFTPDRIEVRQGETVRLRVRNAGKMLHELVIGTRQELTAHAGQMLKHPGMEHEEPYMTHVSPGKSGEIIWTFNRAGEFEFACLIAGHFEAGMKGTIRVVATRATNVPAVAPPADQPGMHHGMRSSMAPQASTEQPYAGQQQRRIKALSEQDMTAYARGQGHGFAKAAELNGYPGPLHTLELARELELSETQRSRTQTLLAQHKAEARRLGDELIQAERALDQAFASRSIDADSLQRLTLAAGEIQARLRAEHLRTHLAQTALLTPQQVAHYNRLRGYGDDQSMHPPEMNHDSSLEH